MTLSFRMRARRTMGARAMSADPCFPNLRAEDGAARRRAEEQLLLHYSPRIRSILSRIVPRSHLDDAVQEAVMDILRGLPSFTGEAKLSTWIYRVTLRRGWKSSARATREIKRGQDAAASATPEPTASRPSASVERDELASQLEQALATLDFAQRSVLALSAFEGLEAKEVAETLGIPVGTVHSRLSRARAQLKKVLSADD